MRPTLDAAAVYGQRLNRSTCVVKRIVKGEFNPETGQHGDDTETEVYSGGCKVVPTGGERVVEFGEGPVTIRTYDVNLDGPIAGVEVGDTVTVAGSRDPKLNGTELVVLDVPGSDYMTNRHLVVEEQL